MRLFFWQRLREITECGNAFKEAAQKGFEDKPGPNEWLGGRWARYVKALEAVSLNCAGGSDRDLAYPLLKVGPTPVLQSYEHFLCLQGMVTSWWRHLNENTNFLLTQMQGMGTEKKGWDA
jgi:hypothetical protein